MKISDNDEAEFYEKIYLLAFDKDKSFFYDSDLPTIIAFLNENYWGDNLILRIKLLAKLMYFDSSVCPRKYKNELIKKSDELTEYLNQNPK
jgi:hypothetical protein